MDFATAEYLTSPASEESRNLAQVLQENGTPPHTALARLQGLASPEEARAVWDLASLRRRALAKFGKDAPLLFFDRDALEMATPARIAAYHARRFKECGAKSVLDLGGGIGADSLAFAGAGIDVTLYERDPARALMAEANAHALGLAERIRVISADVTIADLKSADAAFLDPARRSGRRRWSVSEDDTEPPLAFVRHLQAKGIETIGVKLSPAVPHEIAKPYCAEIEFLSHAGECKEAFLSLGSLRTGNPISAVLLREPHGEERLTGDPMLRCPVGLPEGRYLYEPDPAVIRAHLVAPLAARLSAWQFDPQIAYLVGDALCGTPFADAYEIHGSLPYNRKAVQEALRRLEIGKVVIKKRGFPVEPEVVRNQLSLAGKREAVLLLARYKKRHWAFLACRLDRTG